MRVQLEYYSHGQFLAQEILRRHSRQQIIFVTDHTNRKNYAIIDNRLTSQMLSNAYICIRKKEKKSFGKYKDITYIQRTGKMYEYVEQPIKITILTESELKGKHFEEMIVI